MSVQYSQLYIEVCTLTKKTLLLKERSMLLLVLEIVSLMLLPYFFICLAPNLRSTDVKRESAYVQVIMSLIIFLIFFLLVLCANNMNKKTKKLFLDLHLKCGELSDMVGWTTMGEKQLCHVLDEKIQKPIDEFHEYFISILCLYFGGKKLFWILQLLFQIEILACVALTIIWTINN